MTLLLAILLAAPPGYAKEIAEAVEDTRSVWSVPSMLVAAIIKQESGFNPQAVSAVGAVGLRQIMPFNASKLGIKARDLVNPRLNILAGVRLLAVLLKHYDGDVITALVAYNSGPKPIGKVPSNGETPAYVVRILRFWRDYELQLQDAGDFQIVHQTRRPR